MLLLRGSDGTTVQVPIDQQPDEYRLRFLRMADETLHTYGPSGQMSSSCYATGLARVGWQFTLAMATYDLIRLPRLLGSHHQYRQDRTITQVQTTACYAHLANDPLKAAANRLAGRIAE